MGSSLCCRGTVSLSTDELSSALSWVALESSVRSLELRLGSLRRIRANHSLFSARPMATCKASPLVRHELAHALLIPAESKTPDLQARTGGESHCTEALTAAVCRTALSLIITLAVVNIAFL